MGDYVFNTCTSDDHPYRVYESEKYDAKVFVSFHFTGFRGGIDDSIKKYTQMNALTTKNISSPKEAVATGLAEVISEYIN